MIRVPHSCDFSLHHGGWGRGCLPGKGGGIGDASQARGQGDGKGNTSPAWGAELGIPPRLGTSPQQGGRGDLWRVPTCQSMSSATSE